MGAAAWSGRGARSRLFVTVTNCLPGTRAAYDAAWQLFDDWCQAADRSSLPADPGTVAEFFRSCPAAAATNRRRLLVIDNRHRAVRFAPPGETGEVRFAAGLPLAAPAGPPVMSPAMKTALQFLPSHGWTQGMFGRCDRCMLFLSQQARLAYQQLAKAIVADVATGHRGLVSHIDPVLCGPCALTRWLRVLEYAETRFNSTVIGHALRRADPLTPNSPHICGSTRPVAAEILGLPLLPTIDQWGVFAFSVRPLTPHSLSRIVRDALDGDFGVHRNIDLGDPDKPAGAINPPPAASAAAENPYTEADWETALRRRRDAINSLADVAEDLADVDRQADEINKRMTALLDGLNPPRPA